jgi:hypothetical protein
MLAYAGSDYFANVKIELSDAKVYSSDKQIILESMAYLADMSSKEAGTPVRLEQHDRYGSNVYGFDFPTIDFFIPNNPPTLGGGPIGTYVLFHDVARTVTTMHFLNQRPERRRFRSLAEYRMLRDRVLHEFTWCAAAVAQ